MSSVQEPASTDGLRIGNAEREDAVRVLGEHFAEGRLASDEYEQRVDGVHTATTRGELRPLFSDLPAPYPAFMVPPTLRVATVQPLPAFHPRSLAMEIPVSDRSRVVGGVLNMVVPFGTGRFYTGHYGVATGQLVVAGLFGLLGLAALLGGTLLGFVPILFGCTWSFIDGFTLIFRQDVTDGHGRRLRD
ncbi:uncharacterized protein DUF1707 [Herbihabitans rhizosphaerae]|uniref:Uncharacterized protein DUF1707 n=1 Tax=Herbihabitans rhizosphaerae TaxID=1872711 RepID=A0A4Q7KEA1_9PSEU|nr:DUF1707 domain-containing protein [Herbihabitans rhizosphaerae]RZS29540.1 uncharacterized protein DUF1707 [Herbihabitans rhizosphaerae]